jgi:hypothetical protein
MGWLTKLLDLVYMAELCGGSVVSIELDTAAYDDLKKQNSKACEIRQVDCLFGIKIRCVNLSKKQCSECKFWCPLHKPDIDYVQRLDRYSLGNPEYVATQNAMNHYGACMSLGSDGQPWNQVMPPDRWCPKYTQGMNPKKEQLLKENGNV